MGTMRLPKICGGGHYYGIFSNHPHSFMQRYFAVLFVLLGILIPTVSFAATPQVPTTGLVGYWHLNEGSGTAPADSSGNSYTGATNLTTWNGSGVDGSALNFASTSVYSYVSIPAGLHLPTTGSLSFWVYGNFSAGYQGLYYSLFGRNSLSERIFVRSSGSGTGLEFNLIDGTSTPVTVLSSSMYSVSIPTNTWTNMILSWDTNNHVVYLYKNGVLQIQSTIVAPYTTKPNTTWNPSAQSFAIGTSTYASFTGSLDEVALYNRSISPSEAAYIYSLASAGAPAVDVTPPTTPASFSASALSTSTIALNWATSIDSGSGVSGYAIYRDGSPLINVSSTTRTYIDMSLSTSTSHTYSVYAFDYAGNQSSAATVSVTTLSGNTASWWVANNVTATSSLAASYITPTYTCVRNRYVSKTGNDSTGDGLTPSTAWLTINHATGATSAVSDQPGDCIIVGPGTYNEQVRFVAGGNADTATGYVALVSQVLHGAKIITPTVHSPSWDTSAVWTGSNYVIVDGFDVSAAPLDVPGGGVDGYNAHHFKVLNNIIHDNGGDGADSTGGDYITVKGNVIYNTSYTATNHTSGISVGFGTDYDSVAGFHNVIADNIVFHNMEINTGSAHTDGNGIIIDTENYNSGTHPVAYTGKTLIENNLSFNNGGRGIHAFNSNNVTVRNNTVFDNGLDTTMTGWGSIGEIDVASSSNVTAVNNIAVANQNINPYSVSLFDVGYSSTNFNNTWTNNLVFDGVAGEAPIYLSNTTATITAANGNLLGVDPQFINPALGNFHLATGSPAIGAGMASNAPTTDIELNTRGSSIDLGAYMFPLPAAVSTPSTPTPTNTGGGSVVGLIGTVGTFKGAGSGYIAPRPQIIYPDGHIVYLDATTTNTDSAAQSMSGNTAPNAAPTSTNQTTTPPYSFTTNHTLRDTSPDILKLQQYLNTHGFTIATTGAGSPGYETTYFGTATFKALKKFQVAHGLPASGYFGPLTRAVISGQ